MPTPDLQLYEPAGEYKSSNNAGPFEHHESRARYEGQSGALEHYREQIRYCGDDEYSGGVGDSIVVLLGKGGTQI